MIKSLAIPSAKPTFSKSLSWPAFKAVAQAVFWPDRWLAGLWLLTLGLLLVGMLTKIAFPLIAGIFGILSLHLSIPIQINNLSGRKSWLLLPGFKQLILSLLGALLLLWVFVVFLMIWSSPNPKWIVLPYTALIFSLVMLPTIYVRHMWPLLVQVILLVIIVTRDDTRSWLQANSTTLWFSGVLILGTLLLWLVMNYRWLHPAQRARSETKKTSVFALYGIEIPLLMRLTRRAASLGGTMLLGDGDSWLASMVRAAWATWMAPVIFLLIDVLFTEPGQPASKLWTSHSFLVLLTLCPLFTLGAQQQKSTQRLGRSWLYFSDSRQRMYGAAERAFYQELVAYVAMTVVLALLLLPLPMILPLICYATAATLLLCYMIFALVGQAFWWSISANLLLLLALLLAMDFLWEMPQLIYLASLALVLPVYSLRRFGKSYWLRMDYSQLKPRQLL